MNKKNFIGKVSCPGYDGYAITEEDFFAIETLLYTRRTSVLKTALQNMYDVTRSRSAVETRVHELLDEIVARD